MSKIILLFILITSLVVNSCKNNKEHDGNTFRIIMENIIKIQSYAKNEQVDYIINKFLLDSICYVATHCGELVDSLIITKNQKEGLSQDFTINRLVLKHRLVSFIILNKETVKLVFSPSSQRLKDQDLSTELEKAIERDNKRQWFVMPFDDRKYADGTAGSYIIYCRIKGKKIQVFKIWMKGTC